MKNAIRIIISFLFVLLPLSKVTAQAMEIPIAVVAAFSAGNVEQIAPFIGENLDLTVLSNGDTYTKQQAKGILTDFFRKNTVRSFTLAHSTDRANIIFGVGNLLTATGNYRVYISMRKNGSQLQIYMLRIEND